MKKIKIKQQNYIGFDHKVVKAKLEGNLTYVNDVVLRTTQGKPIPAALYHAKKPNRKKGHKDYVVLFIEQGHAVVMGFNKKDANFKQEGVLCTKCNTALYSVHVHNCHTCSCKNKTMIDGGTDYLRYGGKDMSKIQIVEIDPIANKVYKKQNI